MMVVVSLDFPDEATMYGVRDQMLMNGGEKEAFSCAAARVAAEGAAEVPVVNPEVSGSAANVSRKESYPTCRIGRTCIWMCWQLPVFGEYHSRYTNPGGEAGEAGEAGHGVLYSVAING